MARSNTKSGSSRGLAKMVRIREIGYTAIDLIGGKTSGSIIADVDAKVILVLPQPRQTFDGIETLAKSVAINGLHNPIMVGFFNAEEMSELLRAKHLDPSPEGLDAWQSFDVNGERFFVVLIDGERRFRAMKMALAEGRKHFDEIRDDKKKALRWHFTPMFRCSCDRLTVEEALRQQFSANGHTQVRPEEEAPAVVDHYRYLQSRRKGQKLTLTAYAAEIGRSPETVRRYLRFETLPEHVKQAVADKTITYGVALELVEIWKDLQDHALPPDAAPAQKEAEQAEFQADMLLWIRRAVAHRWTADEAKMQVGNYLASKRGQQLTLGEIMKVEQLTKGPIKSRIVRDTETSFRAAINYFRTAHGSFKTGVFSRESSPFTEPAILRILTKSADVLAELIPDLETIAVARGRKPKERVKKLRAHAAALTDLILEEETLTQGGSADGNGQEGSQLDL